MAVFEPSRCYACKKLFCCIDCCTNHVRNKHPGRESECPLCRSEILIVRNFNHSHFLCHVVINHLPLRCRACGDLFETSADLKALGTCSRRLLIHINSIVQSEAHSVAIHTPSPLKKTPVNPTDQNKDYLGVGGLNSNFESLTSPPIFTRHTSTPMHISLSRQSESNILKAPKSPSFSMKTPGTPTYLITTKGGEEKFQTANTNIEGVDTPQPGKQLAPDGESLDKSESIYASFPPSTRSSFSDKLPLKSILMSKASAESSDSQISNSNFSKSVGNKLGAMQEVSETGIDMDLTDPQGCIHFLQEPVEPDLKTPPPDEGLKFAKDVKDSGKRVRFSDQFELKINCDSTSPNKSSVVDAEEFFEARQSLSEFSLVHSNFDDDRKNEKTAVNNLKLRQYEESKDNDENKENIANAKSEKIRETTAGKQNEEKALRGKVSGSSRVVMMVLVEKTTDGITADLAPLINSGLKKLESAASDIVSSSRTEEVASPLLEEPAKNPKRLSVVSVDSYTSISSIECFKSSASNSSNSSRQSNKSEKSEKGNSSQGVGLFSAVANAVRTALKNISEVVSVKPITSEPSASEINSPPRSNILTTSSRQLTLPSSRSQKRAREDVISFDITETDTDDSTNDIRSPEQKRQRAWYRQIRGRAPIDRMKNSSVNSSRGISCETQCFQQGSLTVGNTLLPLPSRAHQATQTDH